MSSMRLVNMKTKCREDTELYLDECCEPDGEGEEDDDGQPIW